LHSSNVKTQICVTRPQCVNIQTVERYMQQTEGTHNILLPKKVATKLQQNKCANINSHVQREVNVVQNGFKYALYLEFLA